MTQDMPEPTVNVKEEESPAPMPYSEPDIEHSDSTPTISDQARLSGWECQYYSFGKLDDQGTDYFNPSLVMRDDGIWLLTRASGLHPRGFMYGQNAIVAFKLDDQGKQPHHGKILHWPVDNPMQHFEDPRGFYHPRLGQTMIGCCTFLWNGPGDWTGALQAFGAFDNEWLCKKMDYPKIGGNPGKVEKVAHKDYEKNWIWWLHDERLHLLYKANPWTVHVFENRWSECTDYKIEGVTWPYGDIRGGTTPVQVGDLFFTFHHSSLPWKGRYRRYYAGAIAFETVPPYRPKLITQEPLLIGSQNDTWAQRKPLVVFPCGALYLKDKWLISMGVNDLKSAWLELPHESLLERMRPIEDVAGQIFESTIPPKILTGRASEVLNGKPEQRSTSQQQVGNALPGQTTLEKRAQSGRREARQKYNQVREMAKRIHREMSEERREKLRANLVKARAARAAKRKERDQNGEKEKEEEGQGRGLRLSEAAAEVQPRKRRRKRFKRITAEARIKALQEYEDKKKLA
jgi:predicted GH43/DUF377 family glycosyl hydrolase